MTPAAPSTWSALGNVYLVVDSGRVEPLSSASVRRLCGEDADGVVEVVSAEDDGIEVVIWNRDGSRAELSGNGTRIAARWLAERTGAHEVCVRVGTRTVRARLLGGSHVETDMGRVDVGELEVVHGVGLRRVAVGNPHAVVEGDPDQVERIGRLLVAHPAFPGGTNVEVAHVEEPGTVRARVWERGVGETAASGTGAVAVAAATHGGGEVVVRFPGGEQTVRLEGGRAFLIGPAEQRKSTRS